MATTYTVEKEGGVVIITPSVGTRIICKPVGYLSASSDGDDVIITNAANTGEEIIRTAYSNFTSPTAGSAEGLRNLLNTSVLSDANAVVGFETTANLGIGASYVSDLLCVFPCGYTQVQTEVFADQDGSMLFEFCTNEAGTDVVRSLTVPYTAANGYQLFGAPSFVKWIRYTFTNTSGAPQADFYFTTKLLKVPISPQVLRIDGFLSPAMMGTVTRSILSGQKGNGNFDNVTITETSNDSGTYQNLNVVSGARPSQLSGRTPVEAVVDLIADGNVYTPGVGKTFYLTDIILTIDNSDQTAYGRINIRDSLSAGAGILKLPLLVQESPNNETAVQVVTLSFTEPMPFSTGVFFDFIQGTLIVTGVLMGYQE